MGITDKHLENLDEDSYNLFRSMPFLKSLNLSGKKILSNYIFRKYSESPWNPLDSKRDYPEQEYVP